MGFLLPSTYSSVIRAANKGSKTTLVDPAVNLQRRKSPAESPDTGPQTLTPARLHGPSEPASRCSQIPHKALAAALKADRPILQ